MHHYTFWNISQQHILHRDVICFLLLNQFQLWFLLIWVIYSSFKKRKKNNVLYTDLRKIQYPLLNISFLKNFLYTEISDPSNKFLSLQNMLIFILMKLHAISVYSVKLLVFRSYSVECFMNMSPNSYISQKITLSCCFILRV